MLQIAPVRPCKLQHNKLHHTAKAPTRVSHLQIHKLDTLGDSLGLVPVSKSVPLSNDRDICFCVSIRLIGLHHNKKWYFLLY